MGAFIMADTVSYTHLDVYKRQELAGLFRVVVIAAPYDTCVVWCVACPQAVAVAGCGTGFTRLGYLAVKEMCIRDR